MVATKFLGSKIAAQPGTPTGTVHRKANSEGDPARVPGEWTYLKTAQIDWLDYSWSLTATIGWSVAHAASILASA